MKSIKLPIPQNPTVQNFNKPKKKKIKFNSRFKPASMKSVCCWLRSHPNSLLYIGIYICIYLETELKSDIFNYQGKYHLYMHPECT